MTRELPKTKAYCPGESTLPEPNLPHEQYEKAKIQDTER